MTYVAVINGKRWVVTTESPVGCLISDGTRSWMVDTDLRIANITEEMICQ